MVYLTIDGKTLFPSTHGPPIAISLARCQGSNVTNSLIQDGKVRLVVRFFLEKTPLKVIYDISKLLLVSTSDFVALRNFGRQFSERSW